MGASELPPRGLAPMPLTDRAIRNIKPSDRPLRLFDGGGMYLEVSPAGGRWWRLKYRIGGKEKRLSLGVYPDVGLADARSRRDAARNLLANGVDPSERRKEEKRDAAGRAANSFEFVAREWHGKQEHLWAPHYATDVLHRLEGNLFPELGARAIASITAPMLLTELRKIEHRGSYDLAHRVLGVAGQVFRYGVATGRCERDPSGDLRGALTPHKSTNQAAVAPEELPALLRAIDGYDKIGDRLTALALRLLALTFVRTNELVGATWTRSTWTAPSGSFPPSG